MTQYPSLAALRGSLTADDPDQRGDAYSAVYEAAQKPSAVLDSDPDPEVIEALIGADVIPESGVDSIDTVEYRQQVIELLGEIATNTGGA